MHIKRQILHLVRKALAAGVPSAEAHLDRLDPIPAKRCPALLVREAEQGEQISEVTLDGMQVRELSVNVAICIAQAENSGDAADALGLQVELLLAAEEDAAAPLVQQLIALCSGGISLRASRPLLSGEGDTAIAVLLHTWVFTYHVQQSRPDQAI